MLEPQCSISMVPRQYKPIKVGEEADSKIEWEEVKDEKGNPIRISVIKPVDPRDKMGV